jgi:predicted DNA-binding protein with PD1-like motif
MPHTHLHLHVALKQKDKRTKPGNLLNSCVISEMEERCVEKCFNLFFGL